MLENFCKKNLINLIPKPLKIFYKRMRRLKIQKNLYNKIFSKNLSIKNKFIYILMMMIKARFILKNNYRIMKFLMIMIYYIMRNMIDKNNQMIKKIWNNIFKLVIYSNQ